jgi:hypothetical protein
VFLPIVDQCYSSLARASGGLTISADRQAPAQAHGQESKQKVQRRLWSLEEDEKLGVAEGRLGVPGGGWDLAIVGRSVQVGGGYVDDEENDLARKKTCREQNHMWDQNFDTLIIN